MYRYLIIDGQYLLTRNFKLLTSRFDNVTPGSILTTTFQSMAKLRRDFIDFEIPLLIFDTAPYYKSTLVDDYKGSRHYYTESDLEGVTDEWEIKRIQQEIDLNNLKGDAKDLVYQLFPNLGIPCINYEGWEADDLAYLLTRIIDNKSALCSSDSDWSYLVNDHVDWFSFKGACKTYKDMISNVSIDLDSIGGLQMYKAYLDSLYGSHNDLFNSIKPEHSKDNHYELIEKLKDEVTDDLVDAKLFSAQLSTFKFKEFPSYSEVNIYLKSTLNNLNYNKLEYENFIELIKDKNIRISYKYYSEFIDNLKY